MQSKQLEGPTTTVLPLKLDRVEIREPATRIERATCGLRNSENPTSDNLKPQETTAQVSADMGIDGPELSCPVGVVECPTGSP